MNSYIGNLWLLAARYREIPKPAGLLRSDSIRSKGDTSIASDYLLTHNAQGDYLMQKSPLSVRSVLLDRPFSCHR